MNRPSAPIDQAAGLRELFASMPLPSSQEVATETAATPGPIAVHALICPQRPALVLPMAQVCAQWWRQQGVRNLWVDELDFDRREDWPLACQLRYDLAQGLAQHVPLEQTLHLHTQPEGYYASARRLAHYAAQITTPLVTQLQQNALTFDHLLITLDPGALNRPWSVYGAAVHPMILCEATDHGVEDVLTWLNNQKVDSGLDLDHASVVFYAADPDSAQSTRAQAHWQASWQALHGGSPEWVAHVAIAPNAGLSACLPSWHTLAAQWLPRLSRA